MTRTTAEIRREIAAGEPLATKVKEFFFSEDPWSPHVAFKVGHKMRDIKCKAGKFFPDQDICSTLFLLKDFTKDDLEELLNMSLD